MRHTGIIAAMAVQAVSGSAVDDARRLNFALEIENAKNALFDSQVASGAKPGTFTSRALMRIGDHTKVYQSALASFIKEAGGEPYTPCEYEFNPKGEKEFLDLVRSLETMGVQMNVGLVAEMTQAKHRLELARILTTQGRHLAYVNQLAGVDPYPGTSEDTVAPEQAMAFLQNFVKTCPRTRESNYQRLTLHPNSGPPGSVLMFSMPYFQRNRVNATSEDKAPIRRPFCTFMNSQRQVFVASYGQNRCKVPRDIPFGLAKVYVTSMRRPITSQYDSHVLAGPAMFDVRGSSTFPPPFPYPEPPMEGDDSIDSDTDYPQGLGDLLPPLQAYPMDPPALYPQPQYPLLPPIQQFPPITQYPSSSPYPVAAQQPVYPVVPVIPATMPIAAPSAPLLPPLAPYPGSYPGPYGKRPGSASGKQPTSETPEQPDTPEQPTIASTEQPDASEQPAVSAYAGTEQPAAAEEASADPARAEQPSISASAGFQQAAVPEQPTR